MIKNWVIPQTQVKTDYPTAKATCDSLGGLLTRKELTSSLSNTGSSLTHVTNAFIRKISGSLTGEWGVLEEYAGSNWKSGSYWTSELMSSGNQFIVGASQGTVGTGDLSSGKFNVVCKGL